MPSSDELPYQGELGSHRIRALPHVRASFETYRADGLGVHAPEFDVEHVRGAAREMPTEYPIVIDSDYRI